MEQLEVKKLRSSIIVEVGEDGYYIVSYPLFKGCHSYGETIEEALENIKEVIEMCLEEEGLNESLKFVGYREVEIEYAKAATDKSKKSAQIPWMVGIQTCKNEMKGSHVRLKSEDGRITTISVHGNKDIPRGLLRKIIREDLHMSLDVFMEKYTEFKKKKV